MQIGVLHPTDIEKLAELFYRVVEKGKLLVAWQFDPVLGKEMAKQLEARRIPVYPSAERAVRALGALYRYHTMHDGL